MAQARPTPPATGTGKQSALRAAYLLLALSVASIITWLALSGPPETRRQSSAVVVELHPAAEFEAAKAEAARPKAPAARSFPATAAAPGPPATRKITAPEAGAKTAVAPAGTGAAPSPPPVPKAQAAAVAPPPAPAETPGIAVPAPTPVAMPAAPDPALVEETRLGLLPRISPGGRKPWQAYARPFDASNRLPRIAIIINNLGHSGAATEAAIQRLPGAVTLAFAPYSKRLGQWIALARAAGHEVLLDLPMEPVRYPTRVRGAHTLLTSLTAEQNMSRLHWVLSRVTGYVGVVNQMGSRFTASEPHVLPVLMELRRRGLLFVDSRSALRSVAARVAADLGLPRAVNNRFIDSNASRDAIDARLSSLERIARKRGSAVGIGAPFPVTIDRLARWARGLDARKLTLAPISAVVDTGRN